MNFERVDFAGKTHDKDGKVVGQSASNDSEYDKEINGFYSYGSGDSSNYYESQDSADNNEKKTMADDNNNQEETAAAAPKKAKPSIQEKRPSLLQELIAASKQNMSVVSGGTDLHSIEEGFHRGRGLHRASHAVTSAHSV